MAGDKRYGAPAGGLDEKIQQIGQAIDAVVVKGEGSWRRALAAVPVGPATLVMLGTLLLMGGDLVMQWAEDGQMPDAAAWRTVLVASLLAGYRVVQAMFAKPPASGWDR